MQESRALVTGNITEDAQAARFLGITKAQVDSARESGKLFGFLTEKLNAFAEAGEVGAKSYNTQISNIQDSLTQLAGTATTELFAQIKDGLSGITDELGSDRAASVAQQFGRDLADTASEIWDYVQRSKAEVDAIVGLFDKLRNLGRATPADLPIPDPTKNPLYQPGPAKAPVVEEPSAVTQNWYGDAKALAKQAKDAAANREMNRKLGEDLDAAELADMGPRERAARLQRQAEQARASFADDLSQGKGINLASGSGFSPREAQQTIAGMADTEAAKAFEERLRAILEIEKQLADARKDAGDTGRANAEALTSLNEELAIQKELTAGHEGAAKALEAERDLRKELAKIAESDLAPAEKERANQLATQTAELQKQKAAADQLAKDKTEQNKRDAADAELDVATAGRGLRAKRAAKLRMALLQEREKLSDAGFKGDEVESRLARFSVAKNRELMRADGRIGGESRSARDTMGSGLDWLKSPAEPLTAPMSADFATAFHRGGASEMMPVAGAGGMGDQSGAANGGGANVDRAAQDTLDAAKSIGDGTRELRAAAATLAANSAALQQQVANMGDSISNAVSGVSGNFGKVSQSITRAFNELRAALTEIESSVSNIRGY